MIWRDEKYLRLLSPQLERFSQKQPHTFQFRCPLCGDSERMKSKARGYIFPKNTVLMFKCHNCGEALPFAALLRRMSRYLYDQYILEGLRDQREPAYEPDVTTAPPRDSFRPGELPSLADCQSRQSPCYPVYAFAKNRQIPEAAMSRLFATMNARTWMTPLAGEDKAKALIDNAPYLVIPLTLPDGTWYGAQMRLLTRKEYLTFRWEQEPLKVFGLDAWDNTRLTYLLEGPLDTLFIDNAIAGCGSDLLGTMRVMREHKLCDASLPHVYVWDNEPRNREVVHHVEQAIVSRVPVVIWPKGFPKDINDAVREGHTVSNILQVMKSRTFVGLRAELEFQQWKR